MHLNHAAESYRYVADSCRAEIIDACNRMFHARNRLVERIHGLEDPVNPSFLTICTTCGDWDTSLTGLAGDAVGILCNTCETITIIEPQLDRDVFFPDPHSEPE